jgi:hypothetical protein
MPPHLNLLSGEPKEPIMAGRPADEVAKRDARGAQKAGSPESVVAKTASAFSVTAPQTLGAAARAEREAHRKQVFKKKCRDAREQE